MISTSGVRVEYSQVSSIIESLIQIEGPKHNIPGYDRDDIAQEIRLECWRVLEFFESDSETYTPFKFFRTCVQNRLFNLKRGIWVPNNPPCVRCPLWDRANKTCLIKEEGCEKIVNYRHNLSIKAQLRNPSTLEIDITKHDSDAESDVIILDFSIRDALGPKLLAQYEDLILGKEIPYSAKKKIRKIVLDIINNAENL